MLFISRDTCSDSIAKHFRACFYWVSHNYCVICCKMGYRTDVRVLSGTGDSQLDSREPIRESFAIETPIFIARQAYSPESLEFPIRVNHATKCVCELSTRGGSHHFGGVLTSLKKYRAM